jgi:hypothetical protein
MESISLLFPLTLFVLDRGCHVLLNMPKYLK